MNVSTHMMENRYFSEFFGLYADGSYILVDTYNIYVYSIEQLKMLFGGACTHGVWSMDSGDRARYLYVYTCIYIYICLDG